MAWKGRGGDGGDTVLWSVSSHILSLIKSVRIFEFNRHCCRGQPSLAVGRSVSLTGVLIPVNH